MKTEEKNALFLLAGIGVTGWILYAVNAKAAPEFTGPAGDGGGEPAPGETWLVAIWLDPPEFTDSDRALLVREYSGTAEILSAKMVTQNVLGLVLKYRKPATFPAAGTTIPWGSGQAKFLSAEPYR